MLNLVEIITPLAHSLTGPLTAPFTPTRVSADMADRADRADMADMADMADRAVWADTAYRADRAGKSEIMNHWLTDRTNC